MTATTGIGSFADVPLHGERGGEPATEAAVAEHVAAGELSPEEGAAVAGILEAQRRAVETVEMEARITALEQKGSTE